MILKFSLAQTGGGLFRKFHGLLGLVECVLKKMGSLYISGRIFGLGISFLVISDQASKKFIQAGNTSALFVFLIYIF